MKVSNLYEKPANACKTLFKPIRHKKFPEFVEIYAHMLIVVAFLVANFFSFLVIAPSHQLQSGRK